MNAKRKKKLRKALRIRREHRAARQERSIERAHLGRLPPIGGKQRQPAAVGKRQKPPVDLTLNIPKDFSFLSDPTGALKFLAQVDEALRRPEARDVTFDFSKCESLGLCGYIILITKILRLQEERWTKPAVVLAIPSSSSAVNQMLNAPDSPLAPKPKTIIRCPIIRGKAINNRFSKERDKAGTEIVDYLIKCLATEGMELAEDRKKQVGNLITEAIGNAEEHSGPWVAAGYFVQQYATDPGECHLVLFNFGATICQRIESPDASDVIRREAERLADVHLKSGFFTAQILNKWDRETLVTLYALQEGVSSRLHERSSRGNGTIQMIKAFSEFAGTDQRMCILSGSAYILFDGSYGLSPKQMSDTESREVISFNEEKSLEVPPDDRYVKALAERFEGTVVSVRFRLPRGQHSSGERNDV